MDSFGYKCEDETAAQSCTEKGTQSWRAILSFLASFVKTFDYGIMGSFEESDYKIDAAITWLATVDHILLCLLIPVITLNAIIALLGDSYAEVQENKVSARNMATARLILEYMRTLPQRIRQSIEYKSRFVYQIEE